MQMPSVSMPVVFLPVVLLPTFKPATAAAASGHGAAMNDADNVGPFFRKTHRFGKFQESGRHLRPTVEAGFQAGRGVAALALVFLAGGNAAFLAGETGPVSQQVSGADAKTARVGRESGSADGRAVSAGKVRDQPAIVNAGQPQELGACWRMAKLACSGAEGAEDLGAGKHGIAYYGTKI